MNAARRGDRHAIRRADAESPHRLPDPCRGHAEPAHVRRIFVRMHAVRRAVNVPQGIRLGEIAAQRAACSACVPIWRAVMVGVDSASAAVDSGAYWTVTFSGALARIVSTYSASNGEAMTTVSGCIRNHAILLTYERTAQYVNDSQIAASNAGIERSITDILTRNHASLILTLFGNLETVPEERSNDDVFRLDCSRLVAFSCSRSGLR